MRYNFHDLHAKIKADASFKLPDDVNIPVIKYLLDVAKCELGASLLKSMQENAAYGTIELSHSSVPGAKIIIQVDCGMADGYKRAEIKEDGPWTAVKIINVKNANIYRSNNKTKDVKNGSNS